jgi:hypothetical protein
VFDLVEPTQHTTQSSPPAQAPKGTISLFDVTTAKPVTGLRRSFLFADWRWTVQGRKHCFELVTAERRYPIQALSDEDRDMWVKVRSLCEGCG